MKCPALVGTLLCAILWSGAPCQITSEQISFDDLTPAGLTKEQCWNALGKDNLGRIYIGFTSLRTDGKEDFLVFRYDPSSKERRYLGSFMNTASAAGNLLPGEQMPKGHTHFYNINGKMYMGEQGFHDFKEGIDALPTYRGGHLFTYDIAADKMEDIGKNLPDGIVIPHQGIVALSPFTQQNLLVGLAHPLSDIVLYDYQLNTVRKIVPGIPWTLGNPLSREIIVTPHGKVYTYRGTEDPSQSGQSHNIWVYDIATDSMKMTGFTCTGGFWNGQTSLRNGNMIYVITVQGELYRLDVQKEEWSHLCRFIPQDLYDQTGRITYIYGLTLSPDEKKIYGIPSVGQAPAKSGDIYEYDIATNTVRSAGSVGAGCVTGSDLRDSSGAIYFSRFGNATDVWNYYCRLLIVKVGNGTKVKSRLRNQNQHTMLDDRGESAYLASGRKVVKPRGGHSAVVKEEEPPSLRCIHINK